MASGGRRSTSRKQKSKKGANESNQSQEDKFKEVARNLEADESGNLFERAFKKLVPPKRPRPRQN